MITSVFLLEQQHTHRRGRLRPLRALYACVLGAEFVLYLFAWLGDAGLNVLLYDQRAISTTVYQAMNWLELFAGQHVLLIGFVTPVLAAGAIADDKARGTLPLLLTTGLTSAEIVLGKWHAAVAQVVTLALPAGPILAFLFVLAGLDPIAPLAWAGLTVLLAMTLAAAALLAAVWTRRTTAAVLIVYVAVYVTVMALEWRGYGALLSSLAFSRFHDRFTVMGGRWDWAVTAGVLAGVSGLCLALASWRLRPACAAQLAATGRPPRPGRADRPAVGDAPVRWKERYVGDWGPLAFAARLPRWARLGAVGLLGYGVSTAVDQSPWNALNHSLAVLVLPGLLVAVRASAAIAGERERQTWEPLLLTPLSPAHLVRGKVWGIILGVRPYLVAYLVPALVTAACHDGWAAAWLLSGWVLSWGLIYYLAARGVACSARAAGSWPALLATVAAAAGDLIHALPIAMGAAFAVSLVGGIMLGAFLGPPFLFSLLLAGLVTPLVVLLFSQADPLLQEAEASLRDHDGAGNGFPPVPADPLPGRRRRLPLWWTIE